MLGVMAAHTANAGWIYFPAGVPDFSDVDGSHIDFGKNLAREMNEETGLAASDYKAEQAWTTVLAGARIAQIKISSFGGDGFLVARQILAHMRRQAQPELTGVRVVRSPADLDPMMPPYVTAFLRYVWERERGRQHEHLPRLRAGYQITSCGNEGVSARRCRLGMRLGGIALCAPCHP